jgi:hypothetical protein
MVLFSPLKCVCVCVCVCARARVCARGCVCVCVCYSSNSSHERSTILSCCYHWCSYFLGGAMLMTTTLIGAAKEATREATKEATEET